MMIRVFNHHIPGKSLLLMAIEFFLFYGDVYASAWVRFSYESWSIFKGLPLSHENWSIAKSLPHIQGPALLFSVVMLLSMILGGMYDLWEFEGGAWGVLLRVGTAFSIGFVSTILTFYFLPDQFLGRGVYLIACLGALLGVSLVRLTVLKWFRWDGLKRRVLVLGTGSLADRIGYLDCKGVLSDRIKLLGYYPCDDNHYDHQYVTAEQILSVQQDLTAFVTAHDVQEIVVAVRERRANFPLEPLLKCRINGVRVTEYSTFFERELGQLPLRCLSASWLIFSEGFRQGTSRDFNKRMFDLLASTVLLGVTFPIMFCAAVLIYWESGTPLIYRQERVGINGKSYTIYKFRSMRSDAEKSGPQWAGQSDNRITRVGQVLRLLRIDELPQILNVFKGDMSFVGPRPERPFFVDQLKQQLQFYAHRHTVKPGISGWAQVRCPYGASLEESADKLEYDLYYVKNHSMFLDILIIFQTVQVVLWGKGAR